MGGSREPATSIQGGTLVLEMTVSASGEVGDIHVVQGVKGFTREAIEAIKKRKFAAARFEGKPVVTSLPVAFSFTQPIVWWTRRKGLAFSRPGKGVRFALFKAA
ncbi:MAG TPA: TonB family protein [Terriglobia bacterium]|nr:TonB family protein [Terriglobia bacterium]